MADVARRAGVSRQLVGLVFRNQPGAGEVTRRRILAAADELGYRPNTAAQSLRSTSTRSIGVVFNSAESAPAEIVEWLYTFAHDAGYTVIVSTTTASRDERAAIGELIGYRCEALILIAPRSDAADIQAITRRTPTVVIGRDMSGSNFSTVRSHGDTGIESVVRHLADLKHHDIAYVHAADMLDSDLRLSGYRRAIRELALDEHIIEFHGGYTEDCGAEVATLILRRGEIPTAIACNNDQVALGLIHTLLRAGIRVPEDTSVTGYDDSRLARSSFLDLTTARQDPKEMSEAAVDAALEKLKDPDSEPVRAFTSARLVVRGSTQPRSPRAEQ